MVSQYSQNKTGGGWGHGTSRKERRRQNYMVTSSVANFSPFNFFNPVRSPSFRLFLGESVESLLSVALSKRHGNRSHLPYSQEEVDDVDCNA